MNEEQSIRIVIMHYAAPPIIGGVEQTIYHHARLLVTRGHDVHIIAGRGKQFHPQVHFHHVPEVDSRHPDILEVGKELAAGQVTRHFHAVRDHIVSVLRPLLTAMDVTIVHNILTLHKNLPLTAALYQLNSEKVTHFIAWCHDFAWKDELYIPEMHEGYPWDLLRKPWPGVRYVVVSQHRRVVLASLLNLPEQSIAVVPPGVDVIGFLKLEAETRRLVEALDLLQGEPLLLLPARITRRKNIEKAIQIVAELKHFMPNPILVVTGPPGPHNPTNIAYLERLQHLRQEHGVEKNVYFLYEYGAHGSPLEVTDAMVADFYQLADVLLFPSRREGFGIPVLEAGLTRLPIFASNIPPVQESANGFAHTFDVEEDPRIVAQEIAHTLQESSTYHMRKRVLKRYNWDVIVDSMVVPLIREALENG